MSKRSIHKVYDNALFDVLLSAADKIDKKAKIEDEKVKDEKAKDEKAKEWQKNKRIVDYNFKTGIFLVLNYGVYLADKFEIPMVNAIAYACGYFRIPFYYGIQWIWLKQQDRVSKEKYKERCKHSNNFDKWNINYFKSYYELEHQAFISGQSLVEFFTILDKQYPYESMEYKLKTIHIGLMGKIKEYSEFNTDETIIMMYLKGLYSLSPSNKDKDTVALPVYNELPEAAGIYKNFPKNNVVLNAIILNAVVLNAIVLK